MMILRSGLRVCVVLGVRFILGHTTRVKVKLTYLFLTYLSSGEEISRTVSY
jgi:hypothetical protein